MRLWAAPAPGAEDAPAVQEILRILERDARVTPAQIAAQIGLDERAVREQVETWEREGVIRRYKAVVDWERLAAERVSALIDVKVTPERGAGFDDVAARICRFPEVRSVYLVSGTQDLRCLVEGGSISEIADFVARKLSAVDHVTATATSFLLKRYKEDAVVFAPHEEDHRLVVAP